VILTKSREYVEDKEKKQRKNKRKRKILAVD
jgi:hypothetical protein